MLGRRVLEVTRWPLNLDFFLGAHPIDVSMLMMPTCPL